MLRTLVKRLTKLFRPTVAPEAAQTVRRSCLPDGMMSRADLEQLARDVIDQYESHAELIALGRAETYADTGDGKKMQAWMQIAAVIRMLTQDQDVGGEKIGI